MYPNLKLQMWRSGMRQNRLAQLLKIDETSLSRMMNGFRKPTPEMKAKIAVALGSEPDWLFTDVDYRVSLRAGEECHASDRQVDGEQNGSRLHGARD